MKWTLEEREKRTRNILILMYINTLYSQFVGVCSRHNFVL